jgi:hypothetical protein
MNNLFKDGQMTENGQGIGTVGREMLKKRAVELAIINGRPASEVSKSDWEQARRELTGGSDSDLNDTLLESAPESERWDPLPGSQGHKAPESPGDDEDVEGKSNSARLVEEGIAEAEHDQMLQAARARGQEDEAKNGS